LTDASTAMADASLFDPTRPQKYAWHVTKNTDPAFISRPCSYICLVYVVYSLLRHEFEWLASQVFCPARFFCHISFLLVYCVLCCVCCVSCVVCLVCLVWLVCLVSCVLCLVSGVLCLLSCVVFHVSCVLCLVS
jgi:hypothetical protein